MQEKRKKKREHRFLPPKCLIGFWAGSSVPDCRDSRFAASASLLSPSRPSSLRLASALTRAVRNNTLCDTDIIYVFAFLREAQRLLSAVMSQAHSASSSAASSYAVTGEALNIHALLSPNIGYVIPVFQQPYSWNAENACLLFTDVEAASRRGDASYFLGTLNMSFEDMNASSRIVVDGQQRLVTTAKS